MLRFIIPMLIMASAHSYAAPCEGEWQVRSEPQRATGLSVGGQINSELDAWLSAKIVVSDSLLSCLNQVTIRPVSGNEIEMEGPRSSIPLIVYDDSYQNLATRGNGYVVNLTGNETRVWFRIPNGVIAPAGRYRADVQAQITGIKNSKPQRFSLHHKSRPVMAMEVPTLSQPWLRKSGMNYYVDMGEMTKGSTRNIDLLVKSNASVSVKVRSQNGALQHIKSGERIDYSISFDGNKVKASSPLTTTLTPSSSDVVLNVPFVISVEPQPFAYAGKYEDIVTVVMTAN